GRMLTAVVVSVVVSVVLLGVGRVAYGVELPTGTIPGVAVTIVAGSAAFCVLGYALSTATGSADSAQPTVQAIMLPLYFISGVFIPNPNLPQWLQAPGRRPGVPGAAPGERAAPRVRPGRARRRLRVERPRHAGRV